MDLPTNSESTSISLPAWLLQLIDHHCEEKGINRSAIVQQAVRELLLREMNSLAMWDEVYRKATNGSS